MRSCNDVCDEVLRLLRVIGFKLDDTEDHEQIFDALAACTLVREDLIQFVGAHDILTVLRCALADLEGVMPTLKPSAEYPDIRQHPGWKTIRELGEAIRVAEHFEQGGECVSVCDRVIRKLKEAGVPLPNDHKAHRETLAALDKCVILPEGEVRVVVGLQGGLIEDTFAYTKEALADAKQAKMDKQYGLERDPEGYVKGESNNQVITYLLTVDKKE